MIPPGAVELGNFGEDFTVEFLYIAVKDGQFFLGDLIGAFFSLFFEIFQVILNFFEFFGGIPAGFL